MLLHMTLPLHPPVQEEQSYSSDTPTLFKIRQKLSGRRWKSHFNWKYFNIQEIFRLKKNTNCSLCLAQINLCITRSTGIIFKVMVLLFSLISIHFCSLTLRCALKSSSDRLMTGSTLFLTNAIPAFYLHMVRRQVLFKAELAQQVPDRI